ncbi:MAG: NADH:ubiquinone oxidoreductase [Gammaproteobacteria bacterium]|nr:NADH:ubiquinone oxidoreductase [Gammaproteobacteria bacterium]
MNGRVVAICERYGNEKSRLMDILLAVQKELRGVVPEVMEVIAHQIGSYRVEVEGMVSFYAFLSDTLQGEVVIRLCDDIVDRYAGMADIAKIFTRELGINRGQTSADGRFSLEYTPCIGMCDQAPAMMLNERVITSLTPEKAKKIAVDLKQGIAPEDLDLPSGEGMNAIPQINVPVQNNIRHPGEVLLCDQTANAGLKKALKISPEAVLDEIDISGLAGRGGAGFSTARKWRMAVGNEAEKRFVICNADEGEPGTFKDRVLLTERAGLMIEGMTIAAHAIGSRQGIIYLRGEYAYLRGYLESVLAARRDDGFLGRDIGGRQGFDFDIRIQLGAGAYICGEESALINSCEGLRGEPKTRPPFPVESGYLGFPTVVNNVETFCCVARILDQGGDWFSRFGTSKSSGTKLFSVSGDSERPGIYELPFGVKVREIIDLAGAPEAAAIQVGGPGGEMIDVSQYDRRLCAEDLTTSGAITIFSSHRNILEIVEYYMDFFIEESCGYCTPCRVGNVFLKLRIEKIRKGLCQPADLDYLKELGNTIAMTSRCGLGHTSPNPILSSIRNFPLVYAALLKKNSDGLQASFDIQNALEESRRLAKRRSMIYDPIYDGGSEQ